MKFLILLCSLSFFGSVAFAQTMNVVNTYPADGAFAVETDSIVITFDAKVDFDPLFFEDSEFSFFIAPEDSIEQLGARLSDDSLSVIFYGNLAANTDYLALMEYAEGVNGEVLETPYIFQFTTSQTGGQFVVEGYLTQEVLEKQLSGHEENDVIVYLSYEPFEIEIGEDECMDEECEENGDEDAEPVYATFADPETGFYSILGVREGTYFPVALGLSFDDESFESFFPEIYFYDPDEDFEPNSIDVNSTSATNETLSGIDLRKLEIVPITFSEALEIAQDEIEALENNPTIIGGGTFYAALDFSDDSEPEFKSSIVKKIAAPLSSKKKTADDDSNDLFDIFSIPTGYQIEWNIYGYDSVKDSAFIIASAPFGAEFIEYVDANEADLPEGIEFSTIKALPETFIDSDSATTIIEAEGGAEFRGFFDDSFGFWEMEIEAIHRYWDYPENPTTTAPVMWFAEYYGFAFDLNTQEYIDGYLTVILDIETGTVLYKDSDIGGFGASKITFDEALDLSTSFFEALPNDPIIMGGVTNYSSFEIFSDDFEKQASKQFQSKIKAKIDDIPFVVQPDGYGFSWEIYAYDAVKDSIFSFYVTEFDIEFGEYVGEDDLEESIDFDQMKPLSETHIDSDSAAFLIDMEGGLAFRSVMAESELDWEWEMELQLLHQYWDYPLDQTPTAPVTWLGQYYAWAYDEVSEEYFEDSLTVYLDATSGAVLYSTVTVANEVNPELPENIRLDQNYPNPFNPSTVIPFSLSEASRVEISVYSILGQKVATIVNGLYPVGSHTAQWNAQNLASGVYIYRMQAGNFVQTKKLVLLK
ncbi:MAG: hypothetical protein BalsKO_05490 [Balneolaceae bacterium]